MSMGSGWKMEFSLFSGSCLFIGATVSRYERSSTNFEASISFYDTGLCSVEGLYNKRVDLFFIPETAFVASGAGHLNSCLFER